MIQRLSGNHVLFQSSAMCGRSPAAAYSEEEWRTVRSIFIVLRHAIAQLRVVFVEQDVIDFAEAGIRGTFCASKAPAS